MDWIPIDQQKPEPFRRVLVFDPSIPKFTTADGVVRTHNFIVIGYYRGEDDWVGAWQVPDGHNPTHWMPLPDDPVVNVIEDSRGRFVRVAERRQSVESE